MEYVSALPTAPAPQREAEALEVFELIRTVSEQWGFKTATLAAFASTQRTGLYDIYVFKQGTDRKWTFTRTEQKVFNTPSGNR